MRIWIFGQSMSMPHGCSEQEGWPYLLSQQLDAEYTNFSQPGADNLFIYHTFLENYQKIDSADIVIVGWSHPSRKSFVFNPESPIHNQAVKENLQYTSENKTFFRSYNARSSNKIRWQAMSPALTGKQFYDRWFADYYSRYEQECNFQAYLDSVQLRSPAQYLPFYFSQESVTNISRQNDNFMLDFTIANNVFISEDDYHLNSRGHELWAKFLKSQITI